MMEILAIIIVGAIFFTIGWKARELYAMRVVDSMFKRHMMDTATDTIQVDVHKEGDIFYLYNHKDSSFITQVKSKEELFKYFKEKHPDNNVLMKNEDLALFDPS